MRAGLLGTGAVADRHAQAYPNIGFELAACSNRTELRGREFAARWSAGAGGVIQASTAFWPGYTERIEIHGTKGTAIVSGDRLTTWNVLDDAEANAADPAPVFQNAPSGSQNAASGSSDPMAIGLVSFERQFLDFAESIRTGREPLVTGEAGFRALQAVGGIYEACREHTRVQLTS